LETVGTLGAEVLLCEQLEVRQTCFF